MSDYKSEVYFFDLMDRLVKWQRHEMSEPLEVLNISVMKDYENKSFQRLLVIGFIADSDRDIEFGMTSKHPDDKAFIEEMNEWFKFGIPFSGASKAYYQSCYTIGANESLDQVMKDLQKKCDARYDNASIEFHFPGDSKSSGACYIATAVYGSYECPEVWTLRRFRDNVLLNDFFGRLFVKMYYKLSPTMVKYFGETVAFKKFFKYFLDKIVNRLKTEGFSSSKYNDK